VNNITFQIPIPALLAIVMQPFGKHGKLSYDGYLLDIIDGCILTQL